MENLRTFVSRNEGKLIFLLALLVRLAGIGWDLPSLYHTDEPHHLNLAARFGSGDLNPHDFKYPTLWSYLLALVFGAVFTAGKVLGLTRSASEFAQHFLYSPTVFYLAARAFSALLISLAGYVLYRCAIKFYARAYAVALSLFVATGSFFVQIGREATPYSLMIFCVACAVACLHEYLRHPRARDYLLSGLFLGLAISSHYLAAPLVVLLFSLYFLKPYGNKYQALPLGLLAVLIGFILASPYTAVDFSSFLEYLRGLRVMQTASTWGGVVSVSAKAAGFFKTLYRYLDPWGVGFLLALAGFLSADKNRRVEFLAWLAPLIALMPPLLFTHSADVDRYLSALFLPFLLISAYGFQMIWRFCGNSLWKRVVAASFVLLPMTLKDFSEIRSGCLPDTRTLAKQWIEDSVPAGAKILVTDPYFCPQLRMSRGQTARLWRRAAALNHPRQDYFKILYEGHPGGGYEVFVLKRKPNEVMDIPFRIEQSYKAQDWLDPEAIGASGLKREEIHCVVLCRGMAKEAERLTWLRDLTQTYPLAVSFYPKTGAIKGPDVEIYNLIGSKF